MTLYSSTRGKVKNRMFEETVFMGLADDGGLMVPDDFPNVQKNLREWESLNFKELSLEIMYLLISSREFRRNSFTVSIDSKSKIISIDKSVEEKIDLAITSSLDSNLK